MNRFVAACLALCAGLLISACATTEPHGGGTAALNGSNGSTQVVGAQNYRGRFAVSYLDQNGQARNAYGNFGWNQNGSTTRLELLNPLGQTLAVLYSEPAGARLELPNQAPRQAADVEDLMQNTLGFALPVTGLASWLRGLPAPGTPPTNQTADAQGRLAHLTQDGWSIDYLAYADAPGSGVKRMNLSRAEPPLSVKLVLDQ